MSASARKETRMGPLPKPAIERVLRRLEVVETGYGTPCWLWQGSVNDRGYGKVGSRVDGRNKFELVHRVVHAARYGPLTPDVHLDHLCGVPRCVRHTEAVTLLENNRRQQLRALPDIPDWLAREELYIFRHVPELGPESALPDVLLRPALHWKSNTASSKSAAEPSCSTGKS